MKYEPIYFDVDKENIRCACCGELPMDMLLKKADAIRQYLGRPLTINCMKRCETHNATIPGSSPNSRHIVGDAMDIHTETEMEQYELITAGILFGCGAYGIYDTFIHLDWRDRLPGNKLTIWIDK